MRLLFLFLFLVGCRFSSWEGDSATLNNGPIVEPTSYAARTTGLFLYELHSILRDKDIYSRGRTLPKECQDRNLISERNAEACGFRTSCSGSIVKDSFFSDQPVIITAAHCQLNTAFDELNNKLMDSLDRRNKQKFGSGETKTSFSRRVHGAGRLWFYVPASKQWLEIEAFIPHPRFTELNIGDETSNDVAAAVMVSESSSKVRDTLSVDYLLEPIEPKDHRVKQEIIRLANLSASQSATKDQNSNYTFDKSIFASSPDLAVFGFGVLNRFSQRRVVPGVNREGCAHLPNFSFSPEKGCEELFPVSIANQDLPLRGVTLKAAMISMDRNYIFALPRASAPSEGVCVGDSGGPVFKTPNKLMAVVSGGPLPCAGGVSFMTLVGTQVKELGAAIKDPRSR
ncbi:MAG: trypsin-like serine protease [Pseudomonadota bacterium]